MPLGPLSRQFLCRLRAPFGPGQFTVDACLQDQVLESLPARREWAVEVAILDITVRLEKGPVIVQMLVNVVGQVDVTEHGGGAHAYEERIPEGHRLLPGANPFS